MRTTTKKQKAAVRFCEKWLFLTFTGDINNHDEVSEFLAENLSDAKDLYEEIKCEYEAYLWELD